MNNVIAYKGTKVTVQTALNAPSLSKTTLQRTNMVRKQNLTGSAGSLLKSCPFITLKDR
ncbi:MAG: hypothetical protein HRT35_21005 [Algicola sp.]|nr:hypothetical protein [Algicola sp.]